MTPFWCNFHSPIPWLSHSGLAIWKLIHFSWDTRFTQVQFSPGSGDDKTIQGNVLPLTCHESCIFCRHIVGNVSRLFIHLANPKRRAIKHLLWLSNMHLNGRDSCVSPSSVSYTVCTATLHRILNEHNLAIQMNLHGSQNQIWCSVKTFIAMSSRIMPF